MNLQDHLIWRQQDIHTSDGQFGAVSSYGFRCQLRGGAKADRIEHFRLLTAVTAPTGTRLRLGPGIGRALSIGTR
jgi:hypothetical protein